MTLALRSWKLRQAARDALQAGNFERGYQLAIAAQCMQQTREGEALRLVTGWMVASPR